MKHILSLLLFALILSTSTSWAYTTAPRISDKEIIQSLAELKAGQKATNQRINDLQKALRAGLKATNQRIDDLQNALRAGLKATNQRIDDLQNALRAGLKATNQRIDDLDKKFSQRIDDLDKKFTQRIDDLVWYGGVMGGGIFMLITALFGYIVWDRKTMMKPMQERLEKLEHEKLRSIEQLLDQHIASQPDKSLLYNIHATLKDMAKHEPRLTNILKAHSLLP